MTLASSHPISPPKDLVHLCPAIHLLLSWLSSAAVSPQLTVAALVLLPHCGTLLKYICLWYHCVSVLETLHVSSWEHAQLFAVYRRHSMHRVSRNAPLCRLNPNLSRGSTTSQFDALSHCCSSWHVASAWGASHVVYLPPWVGKTTHTQFTSVNTIIQ